MPKTKLQEVVFTILMVFVMVYAMICYNIALNMGGMSNVVFLNAFHELIIMGPLAFILDFFLYGSLSKKLAEDGIIIVVLTLESGSGQVLAGPDIVSRGFVYVRGAESLMEDAKHLLEDKMQYCMDKGITDWGKIKNEIKDSLGDFVWKETKRRPMIMPIIMEV